ncbi:MAG: hypothetical protein CAK86_01310 [Opitutia bacterium AMD-G1]|nr:MAG: hypothetical protein CAK86_01310 [Opitutae bacterium AMD-G1]
MSKRPSEALRLLEAYTQAHGTSGHEDAVRAIFVRELRGRTLQADGLGGVLASPSKEKQGPRVVLTAHMDEIGFLVQAVTHDGFLRLTPVGGWPDGVLAAQRLRIWSRSAQPHQGGAQAASADKVLVDIGARSAESVARLGIRPGDPVVPEGPFTDLAEPGLYSAKAFDNRVGMAALTLATHELDAYATPCDLLAVATVQEEVGCRGAVVAARLAKPDVVIVLEGPPADDLPGLAPHGESQGALGGGVQVRAYDPTAIMNPRLAVRRTGGTDARSFQAHELGVPVIVLGVPARYIHTHNAVIDLADLQACVDLSVALVRRLDAKTVKSLTQVL